MPAAMGSAAVIPQRFDQLERRRAKGDFSEFPSGFDPDVYKGRNVVERLFGRIKEFGAVATRYDRLAMTFRAGIILAGIITWLRDI
ncbi:MAG: transposase [Propionibacteriaceae bacterium]|nr:transposase [Propionibacteriaceae bacterium]